MGTIKRNALHMLNSQVVVTFCQGLQFVVVARAMGSGELGRLAAILAINAVLAPFSGLGLHAITTMVLARGSERAPLYYGNSLLMGLISGLVLVALALLIGPLFLGAMAKPGVIAVFGIADFVFGFFVGASASVFLGLDKHRYAGRFQAMLAFTRLCCALLFVALHKLGVFKGWTTLYPQIWGWFYLAGSIIAAVLVYQMTVRQIGKPRAVFRQAVHDVRAGIFFSVGIAATSVYTDIDKAVLGRVASMEINGAYTAAYRVVAMSYAPVRALLNALQARFFRDGAHGVERAVRSATQMAMYAAAYCVVAGFGMKVAVPLIPWILGKSYQLSGQVLGTLAFLPLFLMLQDVFSSVLMGSGRQHIRSLVQMIAAGLCFLLNMSMAPEFGWEGAAAATYLTQALLAGMVGVVIWYALRAERRQMRTTALRTSS